MNGYNRAGGSRAHTSTHRVHGKPLLKVASGMAIVPGKPIKSVGRNAHLYYDPKTGRKLSRERKA